jgi:hypothetical protein
MPKKVHLDSVNKTDGTVWFTLIFDDSKSFFVEERFDSDMPFIKNKVKAILPSEFNHYTVNGVPLSKLVNFQLNELVASKLSAAHHFN